MGKLNLYRFSLELIGALILGVILMVPESAAAAKVRVKEIQIHENPFSIEFSMTGQVPVKVIQIEETELLVALKNTAIPKGLKVKGKESKAIKEISIEELDGNVAAMVLKVSRPFKQVGSTFDKTGSRLIVALDATAETIKIPPKPPEEKQPATAPPASQPGPEHPPATPAYEASVPEKPPEPAPAPEPEPKPPEDESDSDPEPAPEPEPAAMPPVAAAPEAAPPKTAKDPPADDKSVKMPTAVTYVPPKREKSEFTGDISDIYRAIARMKCDSPIIQKTIVLINKDQYQKAYEGLDHYVLQDNLGCIEQVSFLKAFVYYKSLDKKDSKGLLEAARMFQETLITYPGSALVPFGYASIGIIHTALGNTSLAEGYFDIVRQGYEAYPGMPEVLYHLAKGYEEKGYTDKALRYYQMVFESETENSYIPDAGFGYGKALFEKQQFFNALSIFNYLVKLNVKQIYASPELLLKVGDASLKLSMSREARDSYVRAMNLFPDLSDKDLIISHIGDTYGLEDNPDKAIKFYELVRQTYPGTPGYIKASIGIARYLDTDEKKIEIYEMIKTQFPDNTYARIAMMRLAEIYQKNGEHDKCIKEIEDLLSTHPRGLRYEAVKLMQKAYEELFKKQMKEDGYTDVLRRYESEYVRLNRMESRNIEFSVGMAYLTAGLYEQAFNHLINAYKQYKRTQRSPELLFGLGMAMDESGRDADALKLFSGFSKRFPKDKRLSKAQIRMGKIYLEKSDFKHSDISFKAAYAASQDSLEKGRIRLWHAEGFEKNNDLKKAAELKVLAIKDFAAAPGNNYQALAEAYLTLGDTYVALDSYVQAADAFSKALSFSSEDKDRASIGFFLGDAYQKGNILDKAQEAYEQVVQNYDSVWARLARQRLSTLELAKRVQNS